MSEPRSGRRAVLLAVALLLSAGAAASGSAGAGPVFDTAVGVESETPTPPEETPTPPEDTPTPPEDTSTRTGDTPTPPEDTPTPPEDTPTPPEDTPTPPEDTPTPPEETPTPPSSGNVAVERIECVANCGGVSTGAIRHSGRLASIGDGTFANVRLLNGQGGMDLAALGATTDTRFRVELRIDGNGSFDPQTLVVIGDDAEFVSRSAGDPASVTVEFEPTAGAVNFDVRARSPDEWPERNVTANRQVEAVGIINVAEVADTRFEELEGVAIATNAQVFDPPEYDPPSDGEPPQLRLRIAAPHFEPDGTTLNTGHFRAFLPDALLSAWGVSDPGALTVTAPAGGGTLNVTEVRGGVVVVLSGYHYSAGNVTIAADTTTATPTPTATAMPTETPTRSPTATVATTSAPTTTVATTAPPTTTLRTTTRPGTSAVPGTGPTTTPTDAPDTTAMTPATTSADSPGFTALMAVVAVLIAALARRR